MRRTILATVTVLAIGTGTAGIMIAEAQPAPPPAGADAGPPSRPQGMGWMHRMRGWGEGREGRRPTERGTFALVFRHEDRQLTPPDVQKITEAFLLWRGNHTWKVVNVAAAPDGSIGFSLTTQEGSVIANFTMDPHTGRVTRTG